MGSPEWTLPRAHSPHHHPDRFFLAAILSQSAELDEYVPAGRVRDFHTALAPWYAHEPGRIEYVEYQGVGHFLTPELNEESCRRLVTLVRAPGCRAADRGGSQASERADGGGVADRHGVRHAAGSVEHVQQEAGRVGDVAGGFGVVHAQRGLPERAGRGGHQGPGEQRGGVAVHVPGEHPDDVRVLADDLGQPGRVVEDHAVEERDPDRHRRVVQADEGGHVGGRAPSVWSIQASWAGPRHPAGLPCTQEFAITRVACGYSTV